MSRLARRLGLLAPYHRPEDMARLAGTTAVAASVPLLMRLPLPRVAAVLSAATRSGRTRSGPDDDEVVRVTAQVEAAVRAGAPIVRSGCLTRGVTLYWLLRRAGAPVELCFGVGRVDEELVGHCWLARDGQPYLEPPGSPARFDVVYRIPVSRP